MIDTSRIWALRRTFGYSPMILGRKGRHVPRRRKHSPTPGPLLKPALHSNQVRRQPLSGSWPFRSR